MVLMFIFVLFDLISSWSISCFVWSGCIQMSGLLLLFSFRSVDKICFLNKNGFLVYWWYVCLRVKVLGGYPARDAAGVKDLSVTKQVMRASGSKHSRRRVASYNGSPYGFHFDEPGSMESVKNCY